MNLTFVRARACSRSRPRLVSLFIKEPSGLQKPLSEALDDLQLLVVNGYGKIARHRTLHLAFQALHRFVKSRRRLPASHSEEDADALVAMAAELNAAAGLEQLEEAAVRSLAYTARGHLAPVNAFIGGLAAQEVVKVSMPAAQAAVVAY